MISVVSKLWMGLLWQTSFGLGRQSAPGATIRGGFGECSELLKESKPIKIWQLKEIKVSIKSNFVFLFFPTYFNSVQLLYLDNLTPNCTSSH